MKPPGWYETPKPGQRAQSFDGRYIRFDGLTCTCMEGPGVNIYTVKRSCRCLVCGQKIPKGTQCYDFCYSVNDGGSYNSWQARTGKVHLTCETKAGA